MKNLKNLGIALTKAEQREIIGGIDNNDFTHECDPNLHPGCNCFYYYGWDEDTGRYYKIKECTYNN